MLSHSFRISLLQHAFLVTDDFLVTAPNKEVAEEIRGLIQVFLAERGLELSKAKTLITHINDGFDFLGWSFRKYGGIFLTKPSKGSIEKITVKVRKIIHKAAAWTQEQLIKTLNSVIIGWTNYHRHIVAKGAFKKLDSIIWGMLWRWVKRRHSKKGRKWNS